MQERACPSSFQLAVPKQFFSVCVSVISYVASVLSMFVPHLFFWFILISASNTFGIFVRIVARGDSNKYPK